MLHLRHRLGLLKWHLTQVWPSDIRLACAKHIRPTQAQRAYGLPQLPAANSDLDAELHMLCGEATADMGIWASWSIMRFLPGMDFYLHSDGSLTEETIAAWRRILPKMRLVSASEADERANSLLAAHPALLSWRAGNLPARQDLDYFFFGQKSFVIGMDSDVLCFQPPTAITHAVQVDARRALWMKDCVHAYSMSEDEFRNRYGGGALRVNGGFWLSPRFSAEMIGEMDEDFRGWKREWREHVWSPQTLLGGAFARLGGRPLEPALYKLGLGGHRSSFVVRHYPSPKFHRPRYFTEGIPAILQSLA